METSNFAGMISNQLNAIESLEIKLATEKERRLEAEKVLEMMLMKDDHAEWCLIKRPYTSGCNCMDTEAYSPKKDMERAREYFEKYKDGE